MASRTTRFKHWGIRQAPPTCHIFASRQIRCCNFQSSSRLPLLDDCLLIPHRTCSDGGASATGVICIRAVLGAWVLVLGRFGGPWSRLHPCSQALCPPSTLEDWVWWLPLTGLSGIPLRIRLVLIVAPPFFLGTIPQAYLLLMSLNAVKVIPKDCVVHPYYT